MYTTTKTFHFSGNRQLLGFPVNHPNTQINESRFSVEFELTSISLNKDGYILDLDKLVSIQNFMQEIHNKNMNEVFKFNPTNENLAKFFFKKFKKQFPNISAVIITESPAFISSRYILSHDEEDHIEVDLRIPEIIKFPVSGTQKKIKETKNSKSFLLDAIELKGGILKRK